MARSKTVTIDLGKKYKDSVSGWEGIATARYEYMNGCVRYELSGADKDGNPEGYVFDIQQIVECEQPVVPVPVAPAKTGGSRSSRPITR